MTRVFSTWPFNAWRPLPWIATTGVLMAGVLWRDCVLIASSALLALQAFDLHIARQGAVVRLARGDPVPGDGHAGNGFRARLVGDGGRRLPDGAWRAAPASCGPRRQMVVGHAQERGVPRTRRVMNRLADSLSSLRPMPAVFVVAVALNYLWELAQGPLYEGVTDDPWAWWHCFVASLGDGILVCLIDALGCLVFRRHDWFWSGHRLRIPFLVLVGVVVGVAVEWIGARVLRRWTYEPSMPLIPGLELGLVPVIQMTVLPTVVFMIVAAALKLGSRRRP